MHKICAFLSSNFGLQKLYVMPMFDAFFCVDISIQLQTNMKLTIIHNRETSV